MLHKTILFLVKAAGRVCRLLAAVIRFKLWEKRAHKRLHPIKEDEITMKKSTFAAILAFIAAATGALVAAALYIRRREKELDEYEQLLFSEDFNDSIEEDEDQEEDEEPEAPAESAE